MDSREREFLRAVELLHSVTDRSENEENWYNWAKTGLIWGDGKATINSGRWWINVGMDGNFKDSSTAIKWYMDQGDASVDKIVNNILQKLETLTLGSEQPQHPELGPLLKSINARLKGGSAWLTAEDVSKTPFAPQNNFALRIGLLDDSGQELTYSGEGSLISIAPPGSGKTQCNVFPNLLTWRGPAVVLDVKGEIYAQTSKWRAENVGPVFKFSPLDPAKSHSYNPLSFIRQETDYIWEDSRFLADMMIVPSGGADPFWENKARDVLTAAIAHVCYSNTADQRPMSRITDIIHGGKAWEEMVLGLQTAVDVRSMMQQGTSLAEMNEKTRDSVLQTAQSSLSAWSGERISRVTQKSDWSPLDLRSGRNPTIYICLKPSEVDSYISLLRVFIAQHIRMLTSELPPHGVAPILFLLDELPRLKQMPPVEEAIEIGRQYGLRLWMFAQSLGQLKQAYPNAEGIIGSCAVRIFMNPSSHDGTAEKLSEELGFRESALDGSRLKVVEAADLAGPDYKNYQIVMAASCKPVKVKKAFAWQDAELTKRMGSL
jgi:type IV secretion system protein VirD4